MIASSPGAGRPGDAPPLRLPEPRLLFEARAARLQALAREHAARDWLLLLSRVAAGQALAVRRLPAGRARAPAGGPPLDWTRVPREASWRGMVREIASSVDAPGLPGEAREALRRVSTLPVDALDALADAVLAGTVPGDRVALAVFAGAAIQAWFTALAAGIDPAEAAPAQGACPVCAGAPVAGVVRAGTRLRTVTCALCAAEWNVPRAQCAFCAGEKLEYLHAEGDRGAKAEACRSCRAYLKLFDEDHRPGADAAADDAATLALDLLVGGEGYRRAGPNLYVAAGAVEPG